MTFDDPRSEFNGAGHFADINSNQIDNTDGPEDWYTDAFGRQGKTEPFPGSIHQWIAKRATQVVVNAAGPAIGTNRDYRRRGCGR